MVSMAEPSNKEDSTTSNKSDEEWRRLFHAQRAALVVARSATRNALHALDAFRQRQEEAVILPMLTIDRALD